MTPKQLIDYLSFAITSNFNVLIKGKPGIGKTDIVKLAAHLAKAKLIISHPVVSDPTDYKGLPFANKKGEAEFLPFSDLRELIQAKTLTVFFLDDLGQAPVSVQAAVMQLILAREINGHKISEHVRFIAATNRKEDKAGVSGLLEPVKSRFASIVELETTPEDWTRWAMQNNMPVELMAFIRFRPELLDTGEATKDIVNRPSPRTVANVGRQQAAGIPKDLEFEVYKGAAGEAFAAEYTGFLEMFRNMPNIDQVINHPKKTPVPTEPAILYGLSTALAYKMTEDNIESINMYLDRMPGEFAVMCMNAGTEKNPQLTNTKGYLDYAHGKHGNNIV